MTREELLDYFTSQEIEDVLGKLDLSTSGNKTDRIKRLAEKGVSFEEILYKFRVPELGYVCNKVGAKEEKERDG